MPEDFQEIGGIPGDDYLGVLNAARKYPTPDSS